MVTIAIANPKGGVGKTTSAVSICAGATRLGLRGLIVDLDAQANATRWLMNGEWGPPGRTVSEVLRGEITCSSALVETANGWLLPSRLQLSSLDYSLFGQANPDGRLRQALDPISDRFDLVLVDCPPWLGNLTLNAFVAADIVLIPIDCRRQALEAIPQLMEQVTAAATAYRRPVALKALPTLFERVIVAREVLADIEKDFAPNEVLPVVHKNTKLAEAYEAGLSIFDHAPTSSGAVDYYRVTKELIDGFPKEIQRRARKTTR